MNKTFRNIILIIAVLCLIWTGAVITDYTRCKALKEPIFTISTARDQNGNGYYRCPGYAIRAVAGEFNGNEFVVYDMQFSLFGRGRGIKKTIYDNHRHNTGLLGEDKETVLNYLEALQSVKPDVSGNQEIYTEYVKENGIESMNMILYNNIVAGFEYEYYNLQNAYDFAKHLRKDLELTYGEKTTYPGIVQTNRDYFDNVKDISELKSQYTYYEDWTAVFEGEKQENINKMLSGKDSSKIDIRFELNVIDTSRTTVSVRYIAQPENENPMPAQSSMFNYSKAKAAEKIGDILDVNSNDIYEFHLFSIEHGKSVSITIRDTDDITEFYNRFTKLNIAEKNNTPDDICILWRINSDNREQVGDYHTHSGTFSEGNDGQYELIKDKYISVQELQKIIKDMGYEWNVTETGA